MADRHVEKATDTRSTGRKTRAPVFLAVVVIALLVAFVLL